MGRSHSTSIEASEAILIHSLDRDDSMEWERFELGAVSKFRTYPKTYVGQRTIRFVAVFG